MNKFSIGEYFRFTDNSYGIYKIIDITSKEGFYCMESAYRCIEIHNNDNTVVLTKKFVDTYSMSLGFDSELIELLYG